MDDVLFTTDSQTFGILGMCLDFLSPYIVRGEQILCHFKLHIKRSPSRAGLLDVHLRRSRACTFAVLALQSYFVDLHECFMVPGLVA